MFKLPAGVGRVMDRSLAIKCAAAMIGAFVLSLGDLVGVAVVLPLVELLVGGDSYSPVLQKISDVLGSPSRDHLAVILGVGMASAFILKSVFGLWFRWWMRSFIAFAEAEAASDLFGKFMAAPYWLHRQRGVPEVLRAVNEAVSYTYGGYLQTILTIGSDAITIVGVGVVLLVLMPVPALVAVAYFGVVSFIMQRQTKRKLEQVGALGLEVGLEVNRVLMQALYGFREARLHGLGADYVGSFREGKYRAARLSRWGGFLMELPKYLLELVFFVGVALLIGVVFATSGPETGLGVIALFVAAASRILPSLVRLTSGLGGLRTCRPGVQLYLHELHRLERYPTESLMTSNGVPPVGDIVLRDVHFAYPGTDLPVLDGVSVTIAEGQSVAIVGASGAGKTTMVDIILGLLTPDVGLVLVGGQDIAEDLISWRRNIGVVPQDAFLFDNTLRRNVTLSGGPADEARLARAIDQAQLTDLVDQLPAGLDAMLGERGTRLSGGQRQRISIARALYRDPRYLVLDEATSSLDNETEYRVTETIRALRGRMTIVVVAHRLSTIKHCDTVLFMKDGRIVSTGSFAEVERDNREFARLVELGNLTGVVA